MTVTTYAGLSTAVFRRLDRTAETTVFDDCISLAEAEINRRLALAPVRPMHVRAAATLDAEYYAAPSGIVDVENLRIEPDRILATTPQNMQAMFEADDTLGQPRFYTEIGTDLRLYPAPDQSYAATITYWTKVPALTSVATTNWLSLAHPDVYLTGIEAFAKQDYHFDQREIDAAFELFNIALEKVLSAYPRRVDKAPLRSDLALVGSSYSVFTDR
jgi:hypothetical protein